MKNGGPGNDIAAIARDPGALEAFYREHIAAVQRFVARRVADPYLAADLTADIFLAAIDSAHTYQANRASPQSWLFGVAQNVVAAERRRCGRETRALARFSARALVEADDLAAIVARIDAQAEARQLSAAMTVLSERDRALLELVSLEELSLAEAAAALGMSGGAARIRLFRARRRLRQRLDPNPFDLSETPQEVTT
jgi:RNA polymerase sigma-70 factor (ECF subfamily)